MEMPESLGTNHFIHISAVVIAQKSKLYIGAPALLLQEGKRINQVAPVSPIQEREDRLSSAVLTHFNMRKDHGRYLLRVGLGPARPVPSQHAQGLGQLPCK